jgi:hypothetical protein
LRLVVGTDEGRDAIGRRCRIWTATEIEHTREGKGFVDECVEISSFGLLADKFPAERRRIHFRI